jgi:hypothetical protein
MYLWGWRLDASVGPHRIAFIAHDTSRDPASGARFFNKKIYGKWPVYGSV